MSPSPRWNRRPPGSNWGDFGPDDQLGRINLLTPERVRAAAQEIREGRTFCLSLPLDYPGGSVLNPRRWPPRLQPTEREGKPNMNFPLSLLDQRHTDVVSDDAVLLCLQYSTQWDSFAHVGGMFDADGDGKPEMLYYNGFKAGEHVAGPVDYLKGGAPTGTANYAGALGIETMAEACVQGRGVMIDLFAHFGRERKAVGYDDLMRVLDKDKVAVEEGDMVCIRTGFDRLLLEQKRNPDKHKVENSCTGLDGRDERLLAWITKSGLSVLISDNYAVELLPSRDCESTPCALMPIHEHCLFKLGIHLGEMFLLSDLADWLRASKRYRFFLTAPPLRLPGAVGSPSTAVATV